MTPAAARKQIETILPAPPGHWVGDGFPVASVVSPPRLGTTLDPFVLFDYAAPVRFEPSRRSRGVESHPHRGFETVTLVFQGGLRHRDSAGHAGRIGPGDVQWMTAGAGVLHEEKHDDEFTRAGGTFEVAQLWVNLPARAKRTPPAYQTILADAIPHVELPGLRARLIAGDWAGRRGAARTHTPVVLWDLHARAGANVLAPIPAGFAAAMFVRSGTWRVEGQPVAPGELAVLTRKGAGADISCDDEGDLLVLAGEPLGEPVIAHGPFVMNTQAEIREAIEDFRAGRLGTL